MLNHVKPLVLHSMLDQVWPNSENSLWFRDHTSISSMNGVLSLDMFGHFLKGIQVDALQ